MRRKRLEILLSTLKDLPAPKPHLEQYSLSGREAAEFLWFAINDIIGKRVLDAGCGSGRLAIGCSLLGAWHSIGIDIDKEAVSIALKNAKGVGVPVDFIVCDYRLPPLKFVDVVIQNPPFGIQRRHADKIFVKSSLEISKIIYTMHKHSEENIKFLTSLFSKCGGEVIWIRQTIIRIPPTMAHHKERFHEVKVDIYKVVKN